MKSRLFKALGMAASFLALFATLGGHWLTLQSVAWARMLAAFSRTDSFCGAVVKTFDGKHPCKMCLQIQDGRQEEERGPRKLPLVKTETSPELFCDRRQIILPLVPTAAVDAIPVVPRLFSDFIESPPVPPPRGLAAA